MQENEIKIGNWFEHLPEWSYRNEELKSFLFQWEASDWYALGECTLSLDCIKPIELSPEILEKCGFILNAADQLSIILNSIDRHLELNAEVHGNYFFSINQMEEFGGDSNIMLNYIKYLHQLQNLYWCLTNEELNYTP